MTVSLGRASAVAEHVDRDVLEPVAAQRRTLARWGLGIPDQNAASPRPTRERTTRVGATRLIEPPEMAMPGEPNTHSRPSSEETYASQFGPSRLCRLRGLTLVVGALLAIPRPGRALSSPDAKNPRARYPSNGRHASGRGTGPGTNDAGAGCVSCSPADVGPRSRPAPAHRATSGRPR